MRKFSIFAAIIAAGFMSSCTSNDSTRVREFQTQVPPTAPNGTQMPAAVNLTVNCNGCATPNVVYNDAPAPAPRRERSVTYQTQQTVQAPPEQQNVYYVQAPPQQQQQAPQQQQVNQYAEQERLLDKQMAFQREMTLLQMEDSRRNRRTQTWTTFGSTAVNAGVAVYNGVQMRNMTRAILTQNNQPVIYQQSGPSYTTNPSCSYANQQVVQQFPTVPGGVYTPPVPVIVPQTWDAGTGAPMHY